MFYHEVPNGNAMTTNLYSESLAGFSKNVHKRLADHQNKSGIIHQKTVPIYDNFMNIMKGKMLAIKDQVKLKPDQVIFNQTVLKSNCMETCDIYFTVVSLLILMLLYILQQYFPPLYSYYSQKEGSSGSSMF